MHAATVAGGEAREREKARRSRRGRSDRTTEDGRSKVGEKV
jgi:hypothetical protein